MGGGQDESGGDSDGQAAVTEESGLVDTLLDALRYYAWGKHFGCVGGHFFVNDIGEVATAALDTWTEAHRG